MAAAPRSGRRQLRAEPVPDRERVAALRDMLLEGAQGDFRWRGLAPEGAAGGMHELEILKDISEGCCELTPGMRFTLEYGIAANTAVLELMQRRHKPLLQEISRDREQKGKR